MMQTRQLELPAHLFSYHQNPVTTRTIRHFAVSCPRHGHYQTLDLPKDAPRNQIKAHFYKISSRATRTTRTSTPTQVPSRERGIRHPR
ncbi:hypothetical protein C2E23DRAFT_845856 [Lenzites betulinus]|nr:hypothetical protein C2E23DRAFT_845856 [Lenzites betulinus]